MDRKKVEIDSENLTILSEFNFDKTVADMSAFYEYEENGVIKSDSYSVLIDAIYIDDTGAVTSEGVAFLKERYEIFFQNCQTNVKQVSLRLWG